MISLRNHDSRLRENKFRSIYPDIWLLYIYIYKYMYVIMWSYTVTISDSFLVLAAPGTNFGSYLPSQHFFGVQSGRAVPVMEQTTHGIWKNHWNTIEKPLKYHWNTIERAEEGLSFLWVTAQSDSWAPQPEVPGEYARHLLPSVLPTRNLSGMNLSQPF